MFYNALSEAEEGHDQRRNISKLVGIVCEIVSIISTDLPSSLPIKYPD